MKWVLDLYLLRDAVVTTDEKEKDLGVIIHQTLKSNSQRVAAANSANKTLGMINRTIVKIFGNVFGVGPTNGGIAETPEFAGASSSRNAVLFSTIFGRFRQFFVKMTGKIICCLLYTSPSPRD